MTELTHIDGIKSTGSAIVLDRDLHTTEGKRDSTEIQAGRDSDIHELKIVENGTAVLTTWIMTRPWDLSPYGGPASGFLRTTGFQEVDIASQTVLFTWDPADYIDLKDSNMEFGWDPYGDGLTPETDWDFLYVFSSLAALFNVPANT
jgi:hypothetical protein